MSACQRLAPAGLVAAAVLAITACGSTSGSATTPTTGSSGSTASAPAPQSSGSSAPQANGALPCTPGGVTYNGGVGGAVEAFSIPAGTERDPGRRGQEQAG
jgi:hypothetical protein